MGYRLAGDGVSKDGVFIVPGGNGWSEYQEWAKINTPDPEFTDDQLAAILERAIEQHGNELVDSIGPKTARQKDRMIARAMRLLHKKVKNELVDQGEIDELDAADTLADKIEQIEQFAGNEKLWVLDQARTREELESYNVNTRPWPGQ